MIQTEGGATEDDSNINFTGENSPLADNHQDLSSTELPFSPPIKVIEPTPTDEFTTSENITINNIFYQASISGEILYKIGQEKPEPSQIPQLNFFFDDDNSLFYEMNQQENTVPTDYFPMLIADLFSVLYNWNEEKGADLVSKIDEILKRAKKPAIVVSHGDTFGEKGDEFWGIFGVNDIQISADRVLEKIMQKDDYDLIVLFACNPDGIPLGVESSNARRPLIIRFNMDNSFDILEDSDEPIVVIDKKD